MSIFREAIGEDFSRLPSVLQSVHAAETRLDLSGRCTVRRGDGFAVPLLASLISLPASGDDVPITVRISRDESGETWVRSFRGHSMRSRLWTRDGLLFERLGPMTLSFRLLAAQGRIEWQVAGVRLLGTPLPTRWFRGTTAVEEIVENRYVFDVRAALPWVGLLIHYRGWLTR